jgi:Amidase
MTDLTKLTLADARDALKAKTISARELTDAHISAMEKASALNAYVLDTPDQARAMAKASDEKLAKGAGGPLEGIPLGIKDLYATKGVRTTACSKILGNFVPEYESTVTSQLWRDGAVMLGKLNNDEFAMGSSNESSAFGPSVSPILPPNIAPAQAKQNSLAIKKAYWFRVALQAARLPLSPHNSVSEQQPPTPVVQSVSLRPSQARSGSSRLMVVAHVGVLWRLRHRLIKRVRLRKPFAIPRSCCARWLAMIRKIQHRWIVLCLITKPRLANR